jgi:hypothetical protein
VAIAVATREIQMDTGTPRSVAARELVGELVREPDRDKLAHPEQAEISRGKRKSPVFTGASRVSLLL